MDLPKISVIIPVYNVEKYLHRCVNSVLNQTMQEFEIILINDGSTDNSGKICEEYKQMDKRIKVIHKKNARVSAARNDGIRLAKGNYVSFLDSDDWIEPGMFQVMLEKAEKLNLDLIMCDYKKKSDNYEELRTYSIRSGYYSRTDIKRELFKCLIMFENLEYPPTISNCTCLINLEYIKRNHIYYDEDIHFDEDSLFGSKIMYHANNFYYLKDSYFYNYFYNPNSTTNTYNSKRWNSFILINERLIDYFERTLEEFNFSRQIKINMLYLTLSALGQIKYSGENYKHIFKMTRGIIYHPKVVELFDDFTVPSVSWKTKIFILMIKYKMVNCYSLFIIHNRRNTV